jgi:hypothetical protein
MEVLILQEINKTNAPVHLYSFYSKRWQRNGINSNNEKQPKYNTEATQYVTRMSLSLENVEVLLK